MIAGLECGIRAATSCSAASGSNDLPTRERNIAMAFQFYALYPNLTVRREPRLPAARRAARAARIREKVAETAQVLQLDQVLDRRPSQLAEGEKQRVAVGRCIIRDPSCFLFDEPLSRLDVQLREEMRGEIKLVLQDLKRPTIIVTHDQLEALTMADRIAVMRAGLIEQVATPHGIFAKPANLFVAGFIGTPQMNLIAAELEGRSEDAASLMAGGQRISLPAGSADDRLAAGSTVTLGIRPRKLELVDRPVETTLSSMVDIIEPMGAETLLHLLADGNELRAVVDRRVRVPVGAKVQVRLRHSQTHVFDASGIRLWTPVAEQRMPA